MPALADDLAWSRGCTARAEQCAGHDGTVCTAAFLAETVKKTTRSLCLPLQIDTEGYDATVLEGAVESISSGNVGIVHFEYHGIGVWKSYKLENIVRWFNNLNYVW